jgi:hypothetical protein
MNTPLEDGKQKFREIGMLSSQLPAYVRHCCRALYDGTDDGVLDAFRIVSYKTLVQYKDEYPFIKNHLEIMRLYEPSMVKEMIRENQVLVQCLAKSTHQGLPKRACLHCEKIGKWIAIMNNYGKMNEKGVRNDYK